MRHADKRCMRLDSAHKFAGWRKVELVADISFAHRWNAVALDGNCATHLWASDSGGFAGRERYGFNGSVEVDQEWRPGSRASATTGSFRALTILEAARRA